MKVGDIRVYPVKGMRGRSVTEADVEPWGLAGDRRWMVIDDRGRFLSQREAPALATIDVALLGNGLRFTAASGSTLDVDEPFDSSVIEATIWRDQVLTCPSDVDADRWLTGLIGRPCRLVFMRDPAKARPVDSAFGEPGDRVSFADGSPLLATSTASLHDLRRRAGIDDLSMGRFRSNLVIEGAEAWAEDRWTELEIGDAVFAVVKPCARCVVTTVDQNTGERCPEGEPLRTLATFRRDALGKPIFGQNLIPWKFGRISVGDEVSARIE